MRILLISSIPENLADIKGGVESVTFNLLYGFRELNDELHVMSFRKEVKHEHIVEFASNIKIHYYPFRYTNSFKLFFYLFGASTVAEKVNSWKPDIIHVQGNGTILLLLRKIKSAKVVITPHADLHGEYLSQISYKKKLNHRFVILIQNHFMKRFGNYVFISEYLKKALIDSKAAGKIKSQSVIFNPVKPIFFDVKDNEIGNRMNILYVGPIIKRKGLIDLIKSIGALKSKGIMYNLTVVGGFSDNIYKELIQSAVHENGLEPQIKFAGWLSQEEIVEQMKNSGIFILPSNQESLPMSIIEAMSSGRLAAATDVGGVSEIIAHGRTGYLFPKNDVRQLSIILEDLYNNPDEFLKISREAREYARKNFSSPMIAKKTKEFYSSLIDK